MRSQLATYAQASGKHLENTRQARKWLKEVDADLAGPMARHNGKDYFVRELAMVQEGGVERPVMIARWYEKDGRLVANVHPVRLTIARDAFVIDGREEEMEEIPLDAFLLSVEQLIQEGIQRKYDLPAPSKIRGTTLTLSLRTRQLMDGSVVGVLRSIDIAVPLAPWTHPVRNAWRAKANGRMVHALPIWLYCDDTSGNTSKKWNKHNSILFVLAGLPRDRVQELYNIHFLSTSNVASPLEMMELISQKLRCVLERSWLCGQRSLSAPSRTARDDGMEVWDCLTGESALVIPWVHAFQGDNPMASEFASHIGMAGKCICRVCEVYRKGEPDETSGGTELAVPPAPDPEVKRVSDFLTVSADTCVLNYMRGLVILMFDT